MAWSESPVKPRVFTLIAGENGVLMETLIERRTHADPLEFLGGRFDERAGFRSLVTGRHPGLETTTIADSATLMSRAEAARIFIGPYEPLREKLARVLFETYAAGVAASLGWGEVPSWEHCPVKDAYRLQAFALYQALFKTGV